MMKNKFDAVVKLGKEKKEILLLVGISVLAFLFRILFLQANPPGLFCDEASTGYDAYSLLQTGRDQYGNFLPLFVRSMGDYNEALYRYLTIPSVALLGLSAFSVRLPAAVIGTLTVPVLYFLSRKLTDKNGAAAAAFFLAISPWHIHFSRTAFRAILLPFFFSLGILFLIKAIQDHPGWYAPSGLVFGFSLWTYSASRVFVPLFIFFTVIMLFYTKDIQSHPRYASSGGLIFSLILIGFFLFWISPEGVSRARYELIASPLEWLKNYFSYFNPVNLFWQGDLNLRHSPTGIGQLHLFEFFFILLGGFSCLRERKISTGLLIIWTLLYPIPAAFTAPMNALRSIMGAPLFAVFSGIGAVHFYKLIQTHVNRKRFYLLSTTFLMIVMVGVFIHRYFYLYPQYAAPYWQYGLKEVFQSLKQEQDSPVFISDQLFLPHIFILFFEPHPPEEYQKNPVLTEQGNWEYTDQQIGRYDIDSLDDLPDYLSQNSSALIVIPRSQLHRLELLDLTEPLKSIALPRGGDTFYIYQSSKPDQ